MRVSIVALALAASCSRWAFKALWRCAPGRRRTDGSK